jgi:nitrile hydratase
VGALTEQGAPWFAERMDGIHDLGGMLGFGPVVVEPGEPVFHAPWEGRVFAMAGLVLAAGVGTPDAFRHAIERLHPVTYLTAGYYRRWLAAVETLLVEAGRLAPGAVGARVRGEPAATPPPDAPPTPPARPGALRPVAEAPRFAPGQAVRTRIMHPRGHTRLPRYARGRRGVVVRVHPACVFPDSNAHGAGEQPQHVYAVRFAGDELWGADAEASTTVHLDLFEAYLEPA